jgi:hypothetical protein
MAQDKLRKHIRQIIKEELKASNNTPKLNSGLDINETWYRMKVLAGVIK